MPFPKERDSKDVENEEAYPPDGNYTCRWIAVDANGLSYLVLCALVYWPLKLNKDFISEFHKFLGGIMTKYDRFWFLLIVLTHLICLSLWQVLHMNMGTLWILSYPMVFLYVIIMFFWS